MNVPVIGILGGIGSGKSSVVRRVTDFRLAVIDADRIGHRLLEDPSMQNQIRDEFGSAVFDANGQVIRERLADIVFGSSDDQVAARRRLNAIMHPAIRQQMEQQIHQTAPTCDAVVLDAALLLEAGWADVCDRLIWIDTPVEQRRERVLRDRGWSAEELERREHTQWPLDRKRSHADFIVDNSGTIDAAARQMTDVLRQILTQTAPSSA